MFIEPYYNYNETPMWRGIPIFPESLMRPLPYSYNNDNANQEAMPMTSAVMPQPNKSMQEPSKAMPKPNKAMQAPYKVMPQSNKVMQEPSKAMPQVHADYQSSQIPPTVPIINNPLYNQGWLQTQIGKYIRVDFLLGTGTFQDRSGILQEVGISFIILKDVNTNDLTMCDIYSIRFVTVYSNQAKLMP